MKPKYNVMLGGQIGVNGSPVKLERICELLNKYHESLKIRTATLDEVEEIHRKHGIKYEEIDKLRGNDEQNN